MIATTSSGRRFAALARYLLHGRSGKDTERVAWNAGRNLGLDDPELAAVLMQAIADEHPRVEVPVYHLTINFDPNDPVTPAAMQAVADRVLEDLGLAEHQALMVAHQDRAHPHVHLMVNRVHPETGVAWERWQDRPRIERTLRELERELGLREVAGRLYQLEGQEPPDPARLTSGERRQAARTGELAFPDRVRAHLAELRAARSWTELEETLAAHGLRLERKGQGLVITDGTHQVKASRVARDLSLRRLEERFGVPFPGREREQALREQSPDVAQVKGAVEHYERVTALEHVRYQATQELDGTKARRDQLEHAIQVVRAAEKHFERAMAGVYRDPPAARERFRQTVAQVGPEGATEWLGIEPERFGGLRTADRRRALGLGVTHDETAARQEAQRAASHGRALLEAERRAAALAEKEAPAEREAGLLPSVERALARVKERVGEIHARLRQLDAELREAPGRAMLQRSLARVIARLEPREITQLRLILTAPQRAIAFQGRRMLKDLLLGREEEREE
ncbi:MAG TPA: relaxase/mobilization nuclease domain-containing protein [Gemmatimonadales bacterium]|nr:relaxase/mobilization nuclease domain-containing protein [Gemmatimonadales bacterium]